MNEITANEVSMNEPEVDEQPADETPAGELPLSEPPAEAPPVSEPPVGKLPVGELLVDEPAAGEPEEPPVIEPPVDGQPVEELAANELTADEPPADELPVHEMPVDELAVNELAVEELAADELVVDELVVDELPDDAPSADEHAVNDRAGSDPGAKTSMTADELRPIIECLIFVSEEPITPKHIASLLDGQQRADVEAAVTQFVEEFNQRGGGIEIRQVAGGYKMSTRPEHNEYVRLYLKSQPSAKLSIAALETLAVVAYKQPITIPEIQEIRGVKSSTSAIRTLLDRRLIVAKGHKPVVGRPMMYGTSKEFLLQFGLNDLSELPNFEDFEDLMNS
jgi:segregation and condensation protein B